MKNQRIIEAVINHVSTFANHLEDFKNNGDLDQLKNNFDALHDAIVGAHGKDHLLHFMTDCKEHITDAISFIENMKNKGEEVAGRALVTIEHFQDILNHMEHKINIIIRSNAVDDVTTSNDDARAAEDYPVVIIDASPEEMKGIYDRQSIDPAINEDSDIASARTDVDSEDSDVDSNQEVGYSEEDLSDTDDDSNGIEDLEYYPNFFIELENEVAAMRIPFVDPVSNKNNVADDEVVTNGNADDLDVISI